MSVNYLEQFISSGFADIFGEGIMLGIIFLGLFVGWAVVSRISFESKLVLIVPAFIMASIFIDWLLIIVLLVVGVLVGLGIHYLQQQ